MSILGDIFEGVKNHTEEANEYYREAKNMSREDLREELKHLPKSPYSARYQGYMRAAREKGIR